MSNYFKKNNLVCPKCESNETFETVTLYVCEKCGFSQDYHNWNHNEPNFDFKSAKEKDYVYIGYIPNQKNLAGKQFISDWKSYFEGCKYQCEINGGKNKYFFIRKYKMISLNKNGEPPYTLGNYVDEWHFNKKNKF